MPVYERISAVVSLTIIGLALYFVLEFPREPVTYMLFGSPLTLVAPRQWLMAVLLSSLAMAGTDAVIRSHPDLPDQRLTYLATFWVLPGLLVFLATQILGVAPDATTWAIGLVGVSLLLWLTSIAQYKLVSTRSASPFWARFWQQLIGYSVALGLFIVIYHPRIRSALSATGISVISGMLSLALLRQKPAALAKTWGFAVLIGLIMGQMTWALNYWRISTLQAGLVLLLVFYILIGLSQQRLLATLSRRALWEFGAITLAAMLVIFYL